MLSAVTAFIQNLTSVIPVSYKTIHTDSNKTTLMFAVQIDNNRSLKVIIMHKYSQSKISKCIYTTVEIKKSKVQ